MEPHTEALETVCRHFKAEFADKAYSRMKAAKVKAQKENYRLRKKVDELERALRACHRVVELFSRWVGDRSGDASAFAVVEAGA